MKAVILAAGRGSRLAPLTDNLPKALLSLDDDKTLLDYILASLPQQITQAIVVTGYQGHLVKAYLQNTPRVGVVTADQGELAGTWGALWSAREYLKDESAFLVVNGDDLYNPVELREFVSMGPSTMGIKTCCMAPAYHAMAIKDGKVSHFRPQTTEEQKAGAPICTGAYMLEPGIFETEPVGVGGSEYGLPQTLMRYATALRAFEFGHWHPVNTVTELEDAKRFVSAQK